MSSTILLISLLSAHITGLISEQLLSAAVGGSVLIPCSLPGYPLSLKWFYWQEGEQHFLEWNNGNITKTQNTTYENRTQVLFSSRNISISLDNISPEDDQKIFFAYVNLYDEQKKVAKPSEERCRSRLQVSAPYQDLVLMVNHTTNSATCSARGGYPAAQVSWKGLNRSSDTELDLQGAVSIPQENATKKTFSFTSSVNVTGLKSVTCVVYNPHSHETVNKTVELMENDPDPLNPMQTISTPSPKEDENKRSHVAAIVAPFVVILVIVVAVLLCLRCKSKRPAPDQAQAQDPDSANQPPVEPNPQAQAEVADAPEAVVLLSKDGAVFRRRMRSTSTAARDTDEEAAASPEKENLLENRTSVHDNLGQN